VKFGGVMGLYVIKDGGSYKWKIIKKACSRLNNNVLFVTDCQKLWLSLIGYDQYKYNIINWSDC
jgi:hypothetical protein